MIKGRLWLAIFWIAVFSLTACGAGSGEKTENLGGDIYALNWDKISEEMDKLYVNEKNYPMNESVNYNLDQEKQVFQIILFVKEGTAPDIAVRYITDAAKGINDLAAAQDSAYKASSEDSYGGLFEKLNLHLMVIPGSPDTASGVYLVDQTIPAGTYEAVTAK